MRFFSWMVCLAVLGTTLLAPPATSRAAALGRAAADFDNARPDRGETAWGRLVADAMRDAAHADVAFVNAGALKRGVLQAGDIQAADVDRLLAFGDDPVVTISVSGAQLRAALEHAVQAYPTGSPSFLHCSGLTATFNPRAPLNKRLTSLQIGGREAGDGDTFKAAMPVSLAEGDFTIWAAYKGPAPARSGLTSRAALEAFIKARGTVAPDAAARFTAG